MTAPLLTRPIVRHFIAGYTDLTPLEFATHYRSELNYALASGGYFILSDEPGTCNMAFAHLLAHGVPTSQITIYCSTTSPARGERPYDNSEFSVVEVEGGETERYEAMARVSCKGSIIWLRDGEELGVMMGKDVLEARFSGVREARRCVVAAAVMGSFAFYDLVSG